MNDTQPAPKIALTVGNGDGHGGYVHELTSREALSAYRAAAHMLHEQAHGTDVAWRFCRQEPCRDLPHDSEPTGPAPLSSVGLF